MELTCLITTDKTKQEIFMKMIYFMIVLLQCNRQLLAKDLAFHSVSVTYNVREGNNATLVCQHGYQENVNIIERSRVDENIENLVIVNSQLQKKFAGRFEYKNISRDSNTFHRLTIKQLWRNLTHYTYRCVGRQGFGVAALTIRVLYSPSEKYPFCTFNHSTNGGIQFGCLTEKSDPPLRVEITSKTIIYNTLNFNHQLSAFENSSHTGKILMIDEDIGQSFIQSLMCVVSQEFPPEMEVSDDIRNCSIEEGLSIRNAAPHIDTVTSETSTPSVSSGQTKTAYNFMIICICVITSLKGPCLSIDLRSLSFNLTLGCWLAAYVSL